MNKRQMKKILFNIMMILSIGGYFLSCQPKKQDTLREESCSPECVRADMVDKKATDETVALFKNLKSLSENHILFGHQAATEYGRGWAGDQDRSDVKEATGSHPAVIGHDFSEFTGSESPEETQKEMERLSRLISETYNRGGVTTICWHFRNPIQGNSFYWEQSPVGTVERLIPGGDYHEKYKEVLGRIGLFANQVKGADGKLVPMIFRPYHEFDGDWFWWGHSHTTREDFITLWRFTVSYLRDELDVHNFIYAFSPDCRYNTEEEFLDRYPGDEWVDMVGVDNYADFGRDSGGSLEAGIHKLKIVSDYAKAHHKLAAFTETGLESIPDTTWWTNTLLRAVKDPDIQLSYVLVWRNDSKSETHYYATPKGHPSHANFMEFYNDPFTLFENDLKDIYKW
ncbi:MAG: glycoside hydrolase family 26 protein [Tannerellaceae bacterium]|nr:glycoside hydrolase family 26 protein [Tannerellaceae bacterium]